MTNLTVKWCRWWQHFWRRVVWAPCFCLSSSFCSDSARCQTPQRSTCSKNTTCPPTDNDQTETQDMHRKVVGGGWGWREWDREIHTQYIFTSHTHTLTRQTYTHIFLQSESCGKLFQENKHTHTHVHTHTHACTPKHPYTQLPPSCSHSFSHQAKETEFLQSNHRPMYKFINDTTEKKERKKLFL